MRIIFDLDDTIQQASFRDYPHAIPYNGVIERIREAHKMGATIIISTARGMLSCAGDVEKADQKNRKTIEVWLKENDVPYDALYFGKQMGDFYVDDKALSPQEVQEHGIRKMTGFSGQEVWKVGKRVHKYCENADEVAVWYKQATEIGRGFFIVPKVFSYRNGNMQMEYIEGKLLEDEIDVSFIDYVTNILRLFEQTPVFGKNDKNEYYKYVLGKAASAMDDASVQRVGEVLAEDLQERNGFSRATFCHGDMSAQNIIHAKYGLALIDPCVRKWNTWMLDAAKFRASLNGLGAAIGNGKTYEHLLPLYDSKFTEEELAEIIALELTHYIRILPYAIKSGNKKAERVLKDLINRQIWKEEKTKG